MRTSLLLTIAAIVLLSILSVALVSASDASADSLSVGTLSSVDVKKMPKGPPAYPTAVDVKKMPKGPAVRRLLSSEADMIRRIKPTRPSVEEVKRIPKRPGSAALRRLLEMSIPEKKQKNPGVVGEVKKRIPPL